ncbi:Exocyst complex component EXO70E2 [Vitis vinifera]|uniref:Exocyst subunit Exo70 family protein n=1 Tax=Vitis vinifera TaxID=29760 RepID=A0A438D7M0_VITVI|nr:Exocyst complex component EXO70E2 [Vitis vinifera]
MRILDMYEVLADLLPDIDGIYQEDIGSSVRTECREVLGGLGDCVRATFLEFENAIASNTSTNPFAGGGIHPLTRSWFIVIQHKSSYRRGEQKWKLFLQYSNGSPLRALISVLECNLEDKSKLYRDVALQHLFLMNNIHYMTEKVKNSELRDVFGDEWIRKHNWKFQQHAMNYERASWSSILLLLKEEGIQNSNSNSPSKTVLKDRLRSFNVAFEELYKSQTAWLIPDSQLRDELQISTSLKVVQAYRTFVGRHNPHISDKHIKYSPDDLQNFLLDLFEGSPNHCQIPTGGDTRISRNGYSYPLPSLTTKSTNLEIARILLVPWLASIYSLYAGVASENLEHGNNIWKPLAYGYDGNDIDPQLHGYAAQVQAVHYFLRLMFTSGSKAIAVLGALWWNKMSTYCVGQWAWVPSIMLLCSF